MSSGGGSGQTGSRPRDLFEFLREAELDHYYSALTQDLKVTAVPQLKYVEEDDLAELGLSRPEMRRLKKHFLRECPQTAVGKLKKKLSRSSSARPADRSPGHSPEHALDNSTEIALRPASRHLIPPEQLELGKVLGEGEFCTVYQGVWTSDRGQRLQVAAKVLVKERLESQTDFLKEVTNMHGIEHRNIVRLFGVVLEQDSLKMVTELAPLRSLLECLKEPALRSSFTVPVLCDFAQQVAEGMSYLENQRLIHRDLAARNILVFSKDRVKISDFGMSRALQLGAEYYQTNFNVNLKLPIAWCAPESINYLKFTTATDVWAWGVTLWEMFGYGFQPWAGLTGQQILAAIDEPSCQRLEQPDACPTAHYELMLRCWEHEPRQRPSFAEICAHLPKIIPERLTATSDSTPSGLRDQLAFRTGETVVILDKKPSSAPAGEVLWRGVTLSGKTGLFRPTEMQAFEPELPSHKSPSLARSKGRSLARRESDRKERPGKAGQVRRLHAGMISLPKDDLRHTGHVGSDGTIFGDVSFIGDVEKLPVKVVTPYKPSDDLITASSSMASLNTIATDRPRPSGLTVSAGSRSLRQPSPGASSMATFTSVSTLGTIDDAGWKSEAMDLRREEEEATSALDDFDFRLPKLSEPSLDFGSSLMDEVFKCLSIDDDPKPHSSSSNGTAGSAGGTGTIGSSNGFSCDFLADFGGFGTLTSDSPPSPISSQPPLLSSIIRDKTPQASPAVSTVSTGNDVTPTEERASLLSAFAGTSLASSTATSATAVPRSPALSSASGLSSASSLASSARSDGRQQARVRPLQTTNQDSITSVSSAGSSLLNGATNEHNLEKRPPAQPPDSVSSASSSTSSSSSSEHNSPKRRPPQIPRNDPPPTQRASTISNTSSVASSTKVREPIYAKPQKVSRAEAQREAKKASIGRPVLISGPIPTNATPLAAPRTSINTTAAPTPSSGNPLRALRGGTAVFRASANSATRRSRGEPPLPPRTARSQEMKSSQGGVQRAATLPVGSAPRATAEDDDEEPYQSVMEMEDTNTNDADSFWGSDFPSLSGLGGNEENEGKNEGSSMSFSFEDLLDGDKGSDSFSTLRNILPEDGDDDVIHL